MYILSSAAGKISARSVNTLGTGPYRRQTGIQSVSSRGSLVGSVGVAVGSSPLMALLKGRIKM